MSNLNDQELKQMQHDVLWDDLSDNDLLAHSPIPSKDKDLHTRSKRVIGAINELKTDIGYLENTLNTNLLEFNKILGSVLENPELGSNLQQVGENVLDAIYNVHLEIQKIKAQIEDVNKPVDPTEEICALPNYVSEIVVPVGDTLHLKYDNIYENNFELLLNGIEYEKDVFYKLDAISGTIIWTSKELEMSEDFKVVVQYLTSPKSKEKKKKTDKTV